MEMYVGYYLGTKTVTDRLGVMQILSLQGIQSEAKWLAAMSADLKVFASET